MSVQLPLSMFGLYDTSARLAGQPVMPRTRGECVGDAEARRAGHIECPHVLCRFHLLGEVSRRPEEEAIAAMESRLEGEWKDTCALDVADDGGAEPEFISKTLGVETKVVARILHEAGSRLRARLAT